MVDIQCVNVIMGGREISRPYQKIVSFGVFRRETASGFYPWGNVVSPRKRVAEGLCGCKAHSRTAKCEAFHVAPRLFFMFLFLITFTIRQQCIIYPLEFPTVPTSFRISLFGGGGHSGF